MSDHFPAFDRYGSDVLSGSAGAPHRSSRKTSRDHPATLGDVVEDAQTGWCGAIVRVEKSGGQHIVALEDRNGKLRSFPLGPGFMVDGEPVVLTAPQGGVPVAETRTASGSTAVRGVRARVARESRILVEGRHDAELVEKVWGEDLRLEGVVVEMLDGVDNLEAAVAEFAPDKDRRLGILVDHLVPGSKEARIAEHVCAMPRHGQWVRIVGHPYVDIWQAIKPARVGLESWPHIPRGTDIKVGSLRALDLPARDQRDIALGWKKILGTVRSYADLEPSLLGRVEELIDFTTVG